MIDLMELVKEKAKIARKTICIAEAEDERVLRAADDLAKEDIMDIVLIGNQDVIKKNVKDLNLDLGKPMIIDINNYENKEILSEELYELRKHKPGMTREKAKELIEDYNYFGCMLLRRGDVDAFCSSCVRSTAELMRPALQIIKTREGVSAVSEVVVFYDKDRDRVFFASDVSVIIEPGAEQLAQIAINAADVCRSFGLEPRVAMLSYSTHGSGEHPSLHPIRDAIRIVKEKRAGMIIDGEIQFDAATNPDASRKKCSRDSALEGDANVLVFPNLAAANILYHSWVQLGVPEYKFRISAGMRKPVVIYSRSATWEQIRNLTLLAQMQANAI